MKAMILAAGLGTRLKPWTESHPKALVPVGGVPMLERIIRKLREQGFSEIVVNVHHFASQIVDFLSANDFGVDIKISDESAELLDTGGALLHAMPLLDSESDEPFLVHNVDILSNASLKSLIQSNLSSGAGASLLVSLRDSSRRLMFDSNWNLRGWHDIKKDVYRICHKESFMMSPDICELAFSGIYVARPSMLRDMQKAGFSGKFGIMDYLLSDTRKEKVEGVYAPDLKLIDIGKPDTLSQANSESVYRDAER